MRRRPPISTRTDTLFPYRTLFRSDLPYLYSQLAYLGLVLACLAVAYLLVEHQFRSPWGRMMRAIRDNETEAAALGKDIAFRRLEALDRKERRVVTTCVSTCRLRWSPVH